MKKLLFLFLTLLSFVLLNITTDFVGSKYLISDSYVSQSNTQEDTDSEYIKNTVSLKEYLSMVENGEDPGIEDPTQLPIEIQMLQARSFILRIFIFIIILALTGFAAFAIKSDRIEFSVLVLDSSERGVNTVRISMYIAAVMSAYISMQKYPFTFLWGWIPAILWAVNIIALGIWTINIVYAFKERRGTKNKSLKPARP